MQINPLVPAETKRINQAPPTAIPRIFTADEDGEFLRKKCEPCKIDPDNQALINELIMSLGNAFFSKIALGLAAPQIGIPKRAFIARLFSGIYVFVNPEFTSKIEETAPSTEGCLSCPNITRTVGRSFNVTLDAELVVKVNKKMINRVTGPFDLSGQDAFVVQHEFDHIEGVLLIDRPELQTQIDPVVQKKQEDRQVKLSQARFERRQKNKIKPRQPMSAKNRKKLEKDWKRAEKQAKLRVEMQEMYRHQSEDM